MFAASDKLGPSLSSSVYSRFGRGRLAPQACLRIVVAATLNGRWNGKDFGLLLECGLTVELTSAQLRE